MPGQQNTILFEMKGAAAGAAGSPSPSGMDGGGSAAADGTEKEKTGFFKKMKNAPKQIASFSKSSLGVQFSLAAMLRQSQIATGFLSAMFQVLGAIMDSFLVAFAPTLFSAIAAMSKLIPVARKIGEETVGSVNDMRDRLQGIWLMILPMLQSVWGAIKVVGEFLESMPQGMKNLLLMTIVMGKLFNFMKVGYFIKMYQTMFKASTKAAAMGAARGMGKGGQAMLSMLPIAGIIVAVLAFLPMIMSMFGGGKKDDSQGVDVAGQLGKKYLPSQASRLGTDLNKLMSAGFESTFNLVDSKVSEPVNAILDMYSETGSKWAEAAAAHEAILMATPGPLQDAIGRTAEGMDIVLALYDSGAAGMSTAVADFIKKSQEMFPSSTLPKEIAAAKDSGLTDILSNMGGGGAGSGTSPFVEALNSAKETANLNRDIVGQLSMFSEGMSYLDKEKAKDPVVRRIDQGIQSQLSMYQETASIDRGLLRIAENEAEERKREHQENLSLGHSMAAALGNIGNF